MPVKIQNNVFNGDGGDYISWGFFHLARMKTNSLPLALRLAIRNSASATGVGNVPIANLGKLRPIFGYALAR